MSDYRIMASFFVTFSSSVLTVLGAYFPPFPFPQAGPLHSQKAFLLLLSGHINSIPVVV